MRMGRVRREIADIERELAGFGPHCAIDTVLPEMHRLLETETVLVLTPAESLDSLEVARFQSVGFRDAPGLRAAFADVFGRQPGRYAWYDPICPEPEQRNRLVEAHELMKPGELEQSYIYQRVLVPFGLEQHQQPRVLLCDGASLLAWFGAIHPDPITATQRRMLARLARPIHRRLMLERQLAWSTRTAALAAALEHIGAPAFVLAGGRQIVEANAGARALLATRRADIVAALEMQARASTQAKTSDLEVELVSLRMHGCPQLDLAIVRAGTREARIAACIERAAERWQLTPRQREVVTRIVQGGATPTIAAELHVSGRTIELELSALFERSQTANRAELVAAALLA
jgi:DNA-binding NarL/FixJ family response regulator